MDSVMTNELVLKSPIIMFPPDSLSIPVFILFILTFCSGLIVGYLLALYFQATIWQKSSQTHGNNIDRFLRRSNRLGVQRSSKQSTTDNISRLQNHSNDLDKISTALEDFIQQIQAPSSSEQKQGPTIKKSTTDQDENPKNDLNLTIGELFQTFSSTFNKRLGSEPVNSTEINPDQNTGTYTKNLRDSLFKNLGSNGTHHISFTEDMSESDNDGNSDDDSDVDEVINLVNGDLVNGVDQTSVEENVEDNE